MNDLILILKRKRPDVINEEILQKILQHEDFNLNDYDVSYSNGFSALLYDHQDEIVDFIVDKGFMNFVRTGAINEDVVKAGTPQNKIIQLLQKYLDKIDIDNELIILDPYFFSPTSIANYAYMIENVLAKYLPTIDTIKIITDAKTSKIDLTLKADIEAKLKAHKSTLQIIHSTTYDYHDRYWISSNREKGIVSGTSLNGLGNRLALIDRLNTSDVREIVASLQTDGLI